MSFDLIKLSDHVKEIFGSDRTKMSIIYISFSCQDNAKQNEERLASLRKADLEFDLMTATMTEWNLQGFHYILVKESSAEHSLVRQAQFQAWKKNLREGFG